MVCYVCTYISWGNTKLIWHGMYIHFSFHFFLNIHRMIRDFHIVNFLHFYYSFFSSKFVFPAISMYGENLFNSNCIFSNEYMVYMNENSNTKKEIHFVNIFRFPLSPYIFFQSVNARETACFLCSLLFLILSCIT